MKTKILILVKQMYQHRCLKIIKAMYILHPTIYYSENYTLTFLHQGSVLFLNLDFSPFCPYYLLEYEYTQITDRILFVS